jgi:hypothetical protein
MFRHLTLALAAAIALTLPALAQESDSGSPNKNLDIRSSVGDLHIGNDADAKKVGLPVYPGARIKSGDQSQNQANLSLFTEAFGMELIVANYDSDDAPGKVIDFYRSKLKKYGKVLDCHSNNHGGDIGDIQMDNNDRDSNRRQELKCDQDSGPVTELKVGTEDDQHVVSVEPGNGGKGATFALVYVHTRGKRGEI